MEFKPEILAHLHQDRRPLNLLQDNKCPHQEAILKDIKQWTSNLLSITVSRCKAQDQSKFQVLLDKTFRHMLKIQIKEADLSIEF